MSRVLSIALLFVAMSAHGQLAKCWTPVPAALTASPANVLLCGKNDLGVWTFAVTLNDNTVKLDYHPETVRHHTAGEPSRPGNVAWAYGPDKQRLRVEVVKTSGSGNTLVVWVRMVGWFKP